MIDLTGLQRTPIFAALVGSHNYNLNDANSDRDYKVFVLPTFDDLYTGNQFSSAKVGEEYDYDVHDIRKLSNLLWKANINFIEPLFSVETRSVSGLMGNILNHRDELARMNLPYLWDACQGMFYNKFNALEKGTEGTKHLVEKYGYDTKQATHCFRCLDFLKRFHANGFTDFKKAIWYKDGLDRDAILEIRNGVLTLADFKRVALVERAQIEHLWADYKAQKPDTEHKNWLDEQVKEMVHRAIAR